MENLQQPPPSSVHYSSLRPPPPYLAARPSFDGVSFAAVRNLGERRDRSAAPPFPGEISGHGFTTAPSSSMVADHSEDKAAATPFDAGSFTAVRKMTDRREGSAANPPLGVISGDRQQKVRSSSLIHTAASAGSLVKKGCAASSSLDVSSGDGQRMVRSSSLVPAAATTGFIKSAASPSFVMEEFVSSQPSPIDDSTGSIATSRRLLSSKAAEDVFATEKPAADIPHTPQMVNALSVEDLAAQIRDLHAKMDGNRSGRHSRSRGRKTSRPPLHNGVQQGPNLSQKTTWSKIVQQDAGFVAGNPA